MNTPDITLLIIEVVLTGLALYAAWENLVNKRISKLGFDALILVFGRMMDRKQTDLIYKTPRLIRRVGWTMLLFGIGGIYAIMSDLL